MFEGDFADTCAGKFPLVLRGGGEHRLVNYAQTGNENPSGSSGFFFVSLCFRTLATPEVRAVIVLLLRAVFIATQKVSD